MTIPFRDLTGQSIGWRELGFSTSTRTPSTLTLVGEHAAVFKGRAEPLGALLEGAAEPLDVILWGLADPLEAVLGGSAEPLSVSEELLADSHGTRNP